MNFYIDPLQTESLIEIAISKISADQKSVNRPLFIYGAGSTAVRTKKILENNKIKVFGNAIDVGFFSSSTNVEKKIISLDSALNDFGPIDLVIGIQDYKDPLKMLTELKPSNLINVYAFDTLFFDEFKSLKSLIANRITDFESVYSSLEDSLSKKMFLRFIYGKLTNNQTIYCEEFQNDLYFPADILEVSKDEIFVDGGAYTGDTLASLITYSKNGFSKYYGFEPDYKNFATLRKNMEQSELKNSFSFNVGLWSSSTQLSFRDNAGQSSALSTIGDNKITAKTIDEICPDATFIKLDIEGAELEALIGGKHTIIKNRPKLAICLYHKAEHLIDVPIFLRSLNPKYQFYIRHHSSLSTDLVLYAI